MVVVGWATPGGTQGLSLALHSGDQRGSWGMELSPTACKQALSQLHHLSRLAILSLLLLEYSPVYTHEASLVSVSSACGWPAGSRDQLYRGS